MLNRENDERIVSIMSSVSESIVSLNKNLWDLNKALEKTNKMFEKTSNDSNKHNTITRGLTWALVFFAAVQAIVVLLPLVSKNREFSYTEICGKYRSEIELYLSRNFNNDSRYANLEQIFYSTKRSSCLYSYTIETNIAGKPVYIHNLEDYFTHEKLESERANLKNDLQVRSEFLEKLNKYR